MNMPRVFYLIAVLFFLFTQNAAFAQVQIDPGIAEGLLLERPAPVMPELAARARVQGMVRLAIRISEEGLVTAVFVKSGHPLLNDCAVQAARNSRYTPYAPDGKPVPFSTEIEIPVFPGISKKDYEKDRKLMSQYLQLESKCRALLNNSKWQQAEDVCKENLAVVNQTAPYRALSRMHAYQMVSVAILSQERYKEALLCFDQALKNSKLAVNETDPELAELYVLVGFAHSKTGNLGKARDFYEKGEKILQIVYDTSRNPNQRSLIAPRLKKALEYHISAAEADGAAKEAELLKKRLASLP